MDPSYLSLHHCGELEKRAQRLEERLACCDICPRACGVNRLKDEPGGFCCSGRLPIVASYCDHHGEEPALSGRHGSGTIFFGNCNLRCLFCQNHQISQQPEQQRKNEISRRQLAEYMLSLQGMGCHNINLVSPSHFVPQIVRALTLAVPMGLKLPLAYNSNGYDSVETLKELDGIVDIYLPDLKYADEKTSMQFSRSKGDYVAIARKAIKEMWRHVGRLELDDNGIALKGLIVRHLILPQDLAGTSESLKWLANEVSRDVTISLMSQYSPRHRAMATPQLSRAITRQEYAAALEAMQDAGLEEGWVQELDAASNYLPDFDKQGHPFAVG
jgi:putative pyruvate formate lyase activating enzyme